MSSRSEKMGTDPIRKLLFEQSIPASIGFLVMSVYSIADIYFVSRYVGKIGIAAINIVLPITFLISSIGMAIGIGGSSIISRALGAGNRERAFQTFGNQTVLTISLAILMVCVGALFEGPLLRMFGANDEIIGAAADYLNILLIGVPMLAWAMMSNNVIRAEGKPRVAMLTLLIPAVINIILDPIFIAVLGWGIQGAAWATTIGYVFSAVHTLRFFTGKHNELRILRENLKLKADIVKETFSIGSITLARQGSFSVLAIILNNSLDSFGGSLAIAVYGIIRSLTLFIAFPVIGIMQGFMPIAGYNHGAAKFSRVREVINLSIRWSTLVSIIVTLIIVLGAFYIVSFFTEEADLLTQTPTALRIVFAGVPFMGISMISAAYFQAIGKSGPALFLTLSRQILFIIPFILILPHFMGLNGVWWSFPIGEFCAFLVCAIYLNTEVKRNLIQG
ncbi:MAG: MATE family efflux transporter [Flavobacteriales bacterium]|nr:MATE family efflux transporter [Flavobacteriales bacterium]